MTFTDVASPTTHLIAPGEPGEFADPLSAINAVGEFLSPSGWLMKLAELEMGKDPVKWCQSWLAGDWAAFARCAETWRNLGRSCDALARNIGAGVTRVDGTWQGNAADAALHYFDVLRRNLEEMRDSLYAMGDEYQLISQSVSATGQALGECVGLILDALITASIAVAAGTAGGWTGCGAAMGYALGAVEAQVILKEWERMTALVNAAQVVMNTSCASIGRFGGQIAAGLGSFPLPRTSYDHPAV